MKQLVIGCLVALLALTTGCQSKDKQDDQSGSDGATQVRVQLSWKHTSEFAPLYMAADKGYYADAKIQPEFVSVVDENGNLLTPIDEVVAGRAQFGIADAGTLLLAREAGQPVVAVASLFQHHPMAIVSLPEEKILQPRDLIGKTVQVSASTDEILYALLASQGIDANQVHIQQRNDLSITPLTTGDADALTAWVTNEVVTLIQQNIPYNSFLAYDYGVDMYPNVIFTTEAMIKNNPDMVQGFVDATIKGVTATLAQRDRAVDLTIARDSSLDKAVETLAISQSVPLWLPEGTTPCQMKPDIWELSYQILLGQGVLNAPQDYTQAYDLTFFNKATAGS